MATSEVRPLPGPCMGLPLVGNLLSLDKTRMHLSFMEKAKDYGNIYKLQLGSRPVLILNGFQAIRNALEKQPAVFASRPDFFTFNLISEEMSNYGPSLAFGSYSEQWKLQRELSDTAFHEFTHGSQVRFLEGVAREEAEELVRHLRELKESAGITRLLRLSVTSTILRYMFGRRSSYDDEMLNELVDVVESKSGKVSGSGNPVDLMPWLRFFSSKSTEGLRDYRRKFGKVFSKFIEDFILTGQNNA